MKLCRACDRHVFGSESACPFCGTSFGTSCARLGSWGLAMGLLTAGCGPGAGSGTSEGGSSTAAESSSGGPVTATTAMGSTSSMGESTSSTGTTSLDDGVDSSSDDQGGSFYAGPADFGDLEHCDLLKQNCLPGEKCMPWANDGGLEHNDSRCSPVAAEPAGSGETCSVEGSFTSGIDDCDVGLVCFQVDPKTNEGVCRPLCDPEGAECPDPDTTCVAWYDGALPVCSPACDALVQDCVGSMGCYGVPDIVCDAAACGYEVSPGQNGDACDQPNDCAAGLQCTDAALVPGCPGGRCCAEICDLQDPASCDALPGTSCTQIDPGSCLPVIIETGVCGSN